jgi:endonuclease III
MADKEIKHRDNISEIIKLIVSQVKEFNIPWVTEVSQKHDPYKVLISCILSLRTKDKTTAQASQRLNWQIIPTRCLPYRYPVSKD